MSSKTEIARWETEGHSPRYPDVSHWRNDQDPFYIYLCPKGVSLVQIRQRIKVEEMENSDLSLCPLEKTMDLNLGFHLTSTSDQGGGMSYSSVAGVSREVVHSLEQAGSTCFPSPSSQAFPPLWLERQQRGKQSEALGRAQPPSIPALAEASPGTSGEPLLEEVIQKPRWPGGPP